MKEFREENKKWKKKMRSKSGRNMQGVEVIAMGMWLTKKKMTKISFHVTLVAFMLNYSNFYLDVFCRYAVAKTQLNSVP